MSLAEAPAAPLEAVQLELSIRKLTPALPTRYDRYIPTNLSCSVHAACRAATVAYEASVTRGNEVIGQQKLFCAAHIAQMREEMQDKVDELNLLREQAGS